MRPLTLSISILHISSLPRLFPPASNCQLPALATRAPPLVIRSAANASSQCEPHILSTRTPASSIPIYPLPGLHLVARIFYPAASSPLASSPLTAIAPCPNFHLLLPSTSGPSGSPPTLCPRGQSSIPSSSSSLFSSRSTPPPTTICLNRISNKATSQIPILELPSPSPHVQPQSRRYDPARLFFLASSQPCSTTSLLRHHFPGLPSVILSSPLRWWSSASPLPRPRSPYRPIFFPLLVEHVQL